MPEGLFKVTCPYCEATFPTGKPEGPGDPEVFSVPYTRDVGQFDPKDEDEWFDPKKWSRIGSDYLKFKRLSWERIGILRVTEANVDVRYRVQMCPECRFPFDVYVNYSQDQKLSELWRHIFGPHPKREYEIRPYSGESWTVWLIRRLGKKLKAETLGAVLIGFLLFGFGFLSLVLSGGPHLPISSIDGRFFLYGIASLSVMIILIVQERYVKYLATTHDFDHLLKVKNKPFGINHWRNFTLARFVGVQDEGKLPRLSQVDIISGGIAVFLLLFTRVIYYSAGLLALTGLIGLLIAIYGYKKWRQPRRPAPLINHLSLIFPLIMVLGITVWSSTQWLRSSISTRLNMVANVFDLFFWIVIAYILGTATLMALNTALYVLQGISRIPMNLSPYDHFSLAKPLRLLQRYSTGVMLILFLTIITMVTILQLLEQNTTSYIPVEQIRWLLEWMRWGLAIMFAAIGLGLGRGEYFAVALFYGMLTWILDFKIPVFRNFFIDGPVLTLGIFFTLLIGFQIFKTDGLIKKVFLAAKNAELLKLREQFDLIRTQILMINQEISQQIDGKKHIEFLDQQNTTDLHLQRQTALESMEALLRIADRVEKVPVQRQPFRRVSELSAPVVTSLVLPFLAEFISQAVLK